MGWWSIERCRQEGGPCVHELEQALHTSGNASSYNGLVLPKLIHLNMCYHPVKALITKQLAFYEQDSDFLTTWSGFNKFNHIHHNTTDLKSFIASGKLDGPCAMNWNKLCTHQGNASSYNGLLLTHSFTLRNGTQCNSKTTCDKYSSANKNILSFGHNYQCY